LHQVGKSSLLIYMMHGHTYNEITTVLSLIPGVIWQISVARKLTVSGYTTHKLFGLSLNKELHIRLLSC